MEYEATLTRMDEAYKPADCTQAYQDWAYRPSEMCRMDVVQATLDIVLDEGFYTEYQPNIVKALYNTYLGSRVHRTAFRQTLWFLRRLSSNCGSVEDGLRRKGLSSYKDFFNFFKP